jgi:hypothetical protein
MAGSVTQRAFRCVTEVSLEKDLSQCAPTGNQE